MNRVLRVLVGLLVIVIVVIGAGLIYFQVAFPKVSPAQDVTVEITPERLERGRYLANHVSVCIDCHSKRDWQHYSGPVVTGTEGMGGELLDPELELYARNITPANIGDYTDGELVRVIRTGVTNKGEALFPIMPYTGYSHMSREDVYSIVAYLHSLKPIENTTPKRHLGFPLSLIVKTMPRDAKFAEAPARSDTVAYGKYLTTIAGCIDCHSPREKGKIIPGMEFAGGMEFQMPGGGITRSMNITPDTQSGIGNWSLEAFVERFKMYASPAGTQIETAAGGMNTPMPWTMYAGMTEQDLSAIYAYLRTLKPVNNQVIRFTAMESSE